MIEFDSNTKIAIVQVGTGGTGSRVVQSIAQMISLSNLTVSYVISEPDVVESKNLGNQLFVENDVGKLKSVVLGNRYSKAYHVKIKIPKKFKNSFVQSLDDVNELFRTAVDNLTKIDGPILKILVGCVDNSFSRNIFSQWFQEINDGIYIDVGNTSVAYYSDQYYSENELNQYFKSGKKVGEENRNSGYQGQVIVGVKCYGEKITKCFGDIWPYDEMEKDNPAESSCQETVVKHPQRVLTNCIAAHAVHTVLSPIFHELTVMHEAIAFEAKSGLMRPKLID